MSFLRNPEVKRSFMIFMLLSLLFISCSAFFGIKTFVFTIIICISFLMLIFYFTYLRYKKIRNLSFEIDKILYGKSEFNLQSYAEGELAILQSEIYKMTARLREQAETLRKDKTYLADSIADISHQIRTPLTSINLITSFLSEENLDDEKRLKHTKELFSLLSRIDWLINSLLKISKIDADTVAFKNDIVFIEELIKKASEPIAIPMDLRDQKLITDINGNASFKGDFGWTCEAIENILKNCMEHNNRGGIITVKSQETAIFTEIIISDNGSGIAPEDLPNIFKRFYKGKNSADSSIGIGLALSYMIIAKQNGTLKAENNKTCGAKFTIRFYKSTV